MQGAGPREHVVEAIYILMTALVMPLSYRYTPVQEEERHKQLEACIH